MLYASVSDPSPLVVWVPEVDDMGTAFLLTGTALGWML
jgi:hypothetical protein